MQSRQTLPGRQTAAYRILEFVALSGEFPTDRLSRLPGGEAYKAHVIQSLKQKHLLRTFYKDGLRGYRLTAKAKGLLTADRPERFLPYLAGAAETNHIKSEPARRQRLHRIAETAATMQNAGAAIFPDEKPEVFSPAWDGRPQIFITAPAFYNSREIKELGIEAVKIKGARSAGVLLTESAVFVIYNLGGSLMKWQYRAEMRTKALMQTILCRECLPEQYKPEAVKGLFLGDSMELAEAILTGDGGKQYFLLDGSCEHFYCITDDRKGEKLLKIMCSAELSEKLEALPLADLW